jgi:tRNA modification GTPase
MECIDTIIAQATPPGIGGVGILRVSGPNASKVAIQVLGKKPQARYANYLSFKDSDGKVLDQGIALWFPKPHSFTGEDILELHGHGSTIVLNLVLQSILLIPGIRIAKPGEFSERAFLNNKIDLVQAEAIADMIEASSEQAARSAMYSLQGIFSCKIDSLVKDIIKLRTYIEATLDFPEEDINSISIERSKKSVEDLINSIESIQLEAKRSRVLQEGFKVVIAGCPNAGKSSLLNSLSGHESAIVTDIPGTTRDVLNEHISIDGIPVHLVDTAGLRNTTDIIELIGIKKAWEAVKQANHLLFVVDSSEFDNEDSLALLRKVPSSIGVTIVKNKVDLTGEKVGIIRKGRNTTVSISALTGLGLDLLRMHLEQTVSPKNGTEGKFLARARHIQALKLASEHLRHSRDILMSSQTSELVAENLRIAQQALDEITGKFTSDQLLGKIFSSFCIGK